ncbi:MAG: hypothetical protein JST73_06970 [Actinobacteria bacterium]|nr:hypothetical protein [Actinomycetota bacterium]
MTPRSSPAWIPATRGADGVAETIDPVGWHPEDPAEVPSILTRILAAAVDEAVEWRAEMDITINPEPNPPDPLDFLAIDVDGRRPWHACTATFMIPSGDLSPDAAAHLTRTRWQGVGTGGPIFRVWDGVPLVDVATDLGSAMLAVFPPTGSGRWELAVNVLEPEDDSGTNYDVAASATAAVLRRSVLDVLGGPGEAAPPEVWAGACRTLGFDPGDLAT